MRERSSDAGGAGDPADPDDPVEPIDLGTDPIVAFERWLVEATEAGLPEANAMVLATASAEGAPSARTVLLRGCDERGFVFFTNYRSRKGRDLAANPQACAVFSWHPIGRQVVVTGPVERTDAAESTAYFRSRPRGSQLSAAISPQSEVIESRAWLVERRDRLAGELPAQAPVPRPEHWGGFRIRPETVEFWTRRPDRLHDRLRFRAGPESGAWTTERLAP